MVNSILAKFRDLLPDRSDPYQRRLIAVAILALGLTIGAIVLGNVSPNTMFGLGDETLAAYAVLLFICFPLRLRFVLCIGFIIIWFALAKISEIKSSLTETPLTMFDIKITLANPKGLFDSIGAPSWFMAAIILFLAIAAIYFAWEAHSLLRLHPRRRLAKLALSACWVGVLVTVFSAFQLNAISNEIDDKLRLWTPDGLSSFSRKIGTITFLLYTQKLEHEDKGIFFSKAAAGESLSSQELSSATFKYISAGQTGAQLPNIILVHLESTFNPNKAFHLTSPVISALFENGLHTAALGPLHVNIVGGGSWVTEFEVLTGLDTRLFGYSGYYTHSSLSPYVKEAFPAYLRSKGYKTVAYYSSPEEFFNARNAFLNYGFEDFFSVHQLGVAASADSIDKTLAGAAISKMSEISPERPLFAFVSFMGNHGPHPCQHFSSSEDFNTTLTGTKEFAINCELNEYVQRLKSTADGFQALTNFLDERQAKTGRPFVILGYGDHQPHTFTGTAAYASNDYRPFRTDASIKETIYKIDSSMPGRIHDLGGQSIPTTLVPSILSAYVARDKTELYMPANFYLFDKCGSDFLGTNLTIGILGEDDRWQDASRSCNISDKALTTLQKAGVF